MFCISLAETTYKDLYEKIKEASHYTKLFELRVDYLNEIDFKQLEEVLKLPFKFVFTFRGHKEGGVKKVSDKFRLDGILWALDQKFYLVDVEWSLFKKFYSQFKEKDLTRILVSYHNFQNTPSHQFLAKILEEMKKKEIKKAKIVCMCKNLEDSFRLLDLIFLAKKKGIELISFGMGEKFKFSRILSLFCGAPFTYVAFSKNKKLAPGQFDIKSAQRIYKIFKNMLRDS